MNENKIRVGGSGGPRTLLVYFVIFKQAQTSTPLGSETYG